MLRISKMIEPTGVRRIHQESRPAQYFLGLLEFTQKRLFDPSMMVHFRKRFPVSSIAEINEELYRTN